MLFERTALSRKPEEAIRHDLEQLRQERQLSPDLLLKGPYVLDFLDLSDRYLKKGLEDAILREIEQFLLELGAGFTFIARQKRLQIDNDDFRLTCCSTTANSNASSPSTSSWVHSVPNIKVRWNSTCAGSPNTNRRVMNSRPWASSYVQAKSKSRSNSWNSIKAASISPNT